MVLISLCLGSAVGTHKSLEGRVIVIDGWRDYDAVDGLLKSCIEAHQSENKEK